MPSKKVSFRYFYTLNTLIGTILTACLALLASALLYGSSFKFALPMLFLAVVLCVAHYFGTLTGILGTMCAALIFAEFLFSSHGGPHVISVRARESLNWLLLGGISLSFLFPSRQMRYSVSRPD